MTPSNKPDAPAGRAISFRLSELAERVGGEVFGDGGKVISGAGPFETAGPEDVAQAGSAGYLKRISDTAAGALVVPAGKAPEGRDGIACPVPAAAFARILQIFYPRRPGAGHIHPGAHLGDDISLGENVDVGPGAVIGDHAVIGSGTRIHSGAVIEPHSVIGSDGEIYANVVIRERCVVGDRAILHPGAVIGGDGFGFAPDGIRYHKIPHTGIVRLGDDVEIGANAAIDRGTFGETRIGNGVKIDNMVHVAHNVTVGDHTVLVAHVGIAGSTHIGRHCVIAGQVGIAGHLKLGDHVTVGPQSGVAANLDAHQVVTGSPAIPHRRWLRVVRQLSRLPELAGELREFGKRLARLEEKS